MHAMSVEHARDLVGRAEEYFQRRAMDSNSWIPFKHAGAKDRLEALQAMMVAIAEGSPPFSRTLTIRPIEAMRSVHVEA
jgi:hypothetical protein